MCGETIQATAKKCRFCGEMLPEQELGTPHTAQPQEPPTYIADDDDSGNNTKPTSFFREYFVNSYLRKYARFSGRASRKKYWLSYLALSIISLGLIGVALLLGLAGMTGLMIGGALCVLLSFAVIIPSLALCVRRLRDAGFNPWIILISMIPGIGSIILLVLLCRPTKYTDPETDEIDYDPHNVRTTFGPVSIGITAGCIILFVAGLIVTLGELSSAKEYDLGLRDQDDYYVEASYDDDDEYEYVIAEECVEDESYDDGEYTAQYTLYGTIDNKYDIVMNLDFNNKTGHYYYTRFPDGNLDLKITYFNRNTGSITIVETNEGQETGVFEGQVEDGGYIWGTFTNYKGKEMPFSIEIMS